MNVQEAIAATNKLLEGTSIAGYFSPAQPSFFIEAARSFLGPPAPESYTDADCRKIADGSLANVQGVDEELKRDQDATARTTREQRVIVEDLLSQVNDAFEKKYGSRSDLLDRPLFYRIADEQSVTVYTERWPGRKDGDNFILPVDRAAMFNALLDWAVEYQDA